jgi:hypothetical protein
MRKYTENVCKQEIEHAVKHNKRLIPILHRDIDANILPASLSKINWVFFRESDNFDATFKKLIESIEIDLNHVHAHTRL